MIPYVLLHNFRSPLEVNAIVEFKSTRFLDPLIIHVNVSYKRLIWLPNIMQMYVPVSVSSQVLRVSMWRWVRRLYCFNANIHSYWLSHLMIYFVNTSYTLFAILQSTLESVRSGRDLTDIYYVIKIHCKIPVRKVINMVMRTTV